ncbi:CinA family protein [Nitrosomonadales bacterium]|jgi:nicotinamide-nucleotide amidase|nr:CinA family protein [Nitrosomonadales bacterium]
MQSKDLINLTRVLGEKLLKQNIILTTVESCTGGLMAAQLTDIPGCSNWFDRGFITYSNQSKIDCVGVKKNTINKYGAVSQQTANEMALGGINNSQGNLGLSITGIAGPSGGSKLKPVGTVFFAIAKKQNIIFKHKAFFDGNRVDIREKALLFALNQLLALTL